jgi:hypothetical protein
MVYPTEEFFKEDFKEVTNLDMPDDATILFKTATLPDHFGDYTSVFVIKTTPTEYEKILQQLSKIGFVEIENDELYSKETHKAISSVKSKIVKQYTNQSVASKDYYIALFEDNETILIRRISW